MKNILLLLVLLLLLSSCADNEKMQGDILFDFNWKFALNDHPGAENPDYDDSNWRVLDVPHDFSIEKPFREDNPSGPGGGYAFGGIGWYRKSFTLPAGTGGKRVIVRFEGVYRNSDVWVNGHHLGFRPYGYSTFSYDMTPYLNPSGEPNLLAVKVNTSDQPNSRWYTGAGIYRHVWLHVSNPAHLVENGVFIQTTHVENGKARLLVTAEMELPEAGEGKFSVTSEIRDKQGKLIGAASSTWFVIDIDEKNICRLDEYFQGYNYKDIEYAVDRKPERIKPFTDAEIINDIDINYSDLDINAHVNNVRYIDFILNMFSPEFRMEHEILEIEMNFLKEVKLGDSIKALLKPGKENEYLHCLVNVSAGKPSFSARTHWS